MNCPFCQQWNIASSRRCIFCDNDLEGGRDSTSSGQSAYQTTGTVASNEHAPLARLPMGPVDSPRFSLPASPRTVGYVLAGIGVVLYLIFKGLGC